MDEHTLRVLEYEEVRTLLSTFAPSELSRRIIARMRPSSDPARLEVSLQQVDEARSLLDSGSDLPVQGLQDAAGAIDEAYGANRPLAPGEFLMVRSLILACRRLREFLEPRRQAAPRLRDLAAQLGDHGELLRAVESVVEPPSRVMDSASPKLWDLRRRRASLLVAIRERMEELAAGRRFRPFLQERNWTLRNGRHVLMVRTDSRGHVPGILHDKSASGETSFVEPEDVIALSNELADIELDEDREVARILLLLSQRLFQERESLSRTQRAAAWIEFTAARARMSATLGYLPARLAESPSIHLRGARHPLLLHGKREGRLSREVVPMSASLGEPYRMMVVTGPNTGGKTVCLKTVGLIQLMFQSGLHVPVAPGTELPCLGAIYADIGDEQNLSQSLSTFSGHIRNIVPILQECDRNSLVLLDELGAGTDPVEGAALGEAILEKLRETGALCMVTTHLGNLKTYAFSRPDVENASMAFDPESLEPAYELLVGQPGASHALKIAGRYGMPRDVLERAEELCASTDRTAERLMEELMVSRIEAERHRDASKKLLLDSKARLDDAEAQLAEAEAQRERLESEAESEVSRIIEDFAARARPHLNALKNVPKALVPHVEALDGIVGRRLRTRAFAERRREFLAGLKRYDQVYVPKFSKVGRIERFNRSEERLAVKFGDLVVEIGFDDVSWVTPPDV